MFTQRVLAKQVNETRSCTWVQMSFFVPSYIMPVATSSRRKQNSRRQNSEDIEDVRNTQTDGNIDEVSEEDRPRITNKVIVKKEHRRRSNGKQRADPEDDDGDDEDNDEDENDDDRINVQDFPDQPLRKDDMNKLKGFATDWISMRDRISKKWEIYRDVGVAMAEAGEKDMYSSKVKNTCVPSIVGEHDHIKTPSRSCKNWIAI